MKKAITLALFLALTLLAKSQSILNESFNVTSVTNTMPTGWTLLTTGSTNGCNGVDWNQVPSGGFNCTLNGTPLPRPNGHTGSGMAGYNSWDITNGSTSELISPALNFSGLGTQTLSFWVYNQQAFYGNDSLRVFVNTSPTSVGGTMLDAFVPNYNPPLTGWTQYSYTIPTTYTGTTNYIIFRGVSNYGYDIFLDDVDVTHNPPTPCSGTPAAPIITSSAITVTNPVCSGNTITINAVDPNFPTIGGINYQWEVSSSASGPWVSVSSGTGGTTLSYTTSSLTSSTYFRMSSTCLASGISAYTGIFFVPVGAPQPGAISGKANFCNGDTATYSVPNVTGTTYTWALPGYDWSGSSTTNSILTTPGITPGNISVTATTSCGTSAPRVYAVITGSSPATPTTISGNNNICSGTTQTYTITSVTGAVNYSWTLPSGWSTSGTGNSTSITTTATSTGGNVEVNASNGCGTSLPSILAINVITSLPNPGTITGNANPCSGVLNAYSINPVAGATSYQWILPSGWSGTTTGTSIQAFAGNTGTISVTAISPCATSPAATLNTAVIPSVVPSVSVSGSALMICQSAMDTFTASAVNGGISPTYVWYKNGAQVYGNGRYYYDNTLVTGDDIRVTLASSAICRTADSVSINLPITNVVPQSIPGVNVNATPVPSECAGNPRNFTSLITGGGSSPLYQWYVNSVPIPGANLSTYTSSMLNDKDTVTLLLTTNALCPSMPYAFSNQVIVNVISNVVPSVSVLASSNTPSNGYPITFTSTQTGGGPTPAYQWFRNSVLIPGETFDTYTSSTLQPGDHIALRMFSYAPCASPDLVFSNDIVMKQSTNVPGINTWDGSVSIYPNPSDGHFTLAVSSGSTHTGKRVSISIVTMIGQEVFYSEVVPDKSEWHFDVQLAEGIANGNYAIHIRSEDGMRSTSQFVLRR